MIERIKLSLILKNWGTYISLEALLLVKLGLYLSFGKLEEPRDFPFIVGSKQQ